MSGYSIWRATEAEWDAWAVTTEEDGTERPATEGELLNRGVVMADRDGDVLYHCMILDPARRVGLPGEMLTEGRLRERHTALPDVALKVRAYDATVYRAAGVNLRTEAEAAVGRGLGAKVPANGSRSARPTDPEGAALVLQEAQRRWQDEDDPTERIRVRMVDVLDSDVVEEDGVPRIRFAGE